MKQEYKNAFNQLSISDEANEKLMQIPENSKNTNNRRRFFRKHPIIKLAYAILIIAVLSIPTITVLAANGIDVRTIFGGLFGEKAELIKKHASEPQVTVIENTFEDIDISIKGIAGDKSLIYIILELARKDEGPFEDGDYNFASKFLDLEKKVELLQDDTLRNNYKNRADTADEIIRSSTEVRKGDREGIDYLQKRSEYFINISDEELPEHIKTFAYIVNIETEMYGQHYFIPEETYKLTLNDFTKSGEEVSAGIWDVEFVANYTESDEIFIEVNQAARMPEWGTDDVYLEEYELDVSNINLSNLALRYSGEYDNTFDNYSEPGYWSQLYVEMEDGDIIGVSTFDEMIDIIFSDSAPRRMISGGKFHEDPWKYRWIFNEPIDISKVKTIHIGSLSIDVNR